MLLVPTVHRDCCRVSTFLTNLEMSRSLTAVKGKCQKIGIKNVKCEKILFGKAFIVKIVFAAIPLSGGIGGAFLVDCIAC